MPEPGQEGSVDWSGIKLTPPSSQSIQGCDRVDSACNQLFENTSLCCVYGRILYANAAPADFEVIKANKAFYELTGLVEVEKKSAKELCPRILGNNSELLEVLKKVAGEGAAANTELYFSCFDAWIDLSAYSPSRDHVMAIFSVITERKRLEKELRAEKEAAQEMLNNLPAQVLLAGPDMRIRAGNSYLPHHMNLDIAEYVGMDLASIFPKKVADNRRDMIADAIASMTPIKFEDDWDGKHYAISIAPVQDGSRDSQSALLFAYDATEQAIREESIKSQLAEKEVFLREVHHRIKNNMSMVSSLLSLHAKGSAGDSPMTAIDLAKSQIDSMSLLYDRLTRSSTADALPIAGYLPSLLKEIVSAFSSPARIQIDTDIEDFAIPAKTLSIIGVILNELICNSMKHAFEGRETGRIALSASKANGLINICYGDDGPGIATEVELDSQTSFGMRLVFMLVQQLNGSIDIDRGAGTRFNMKLPI